MGRSFTANSGTTAAVLLKGRSSSANSGNKVAVFRGMNRCGSFPLLPAPHSLVSIWTDLRRSEKNPEAPSWRWREWIWLTGPSGLDRNSPQGLNIKLNRNSNCLVCDISFHSDLADNSSSPKILYIDIRYVPGQDWAMVVPTSAIRFREFPFSTGWGPTPLQ